MLQTAVLTALVLLLAHGAAFGQIVDLEGRYWFTDLEANMRTKSGPIPGSEIDLGDDLGLTSDNAPEGRLTFFTGPSSRIRLAYARLDFQDEEVVGRTITFGDQTFTANSRIASDIEVHYGRLGWIWQPLGIPRVAKFGGILEAKGFLVDASIGSLGVVPQTRESVSFSLGLPTLGLALDLTPLPMLHVFAEASGLHAGNLGYMVDAEAGVRFLPLPLFTLSAGYRIIDFRIETGGELAKIKLTGPFVGASFRF